MVVGRSTLLGLPEAGCGLSMGDGLEPERGKREIRQSRILSAWLVSLKFILKAVGNSGRILSRRATWSGLHFRKTGLPITRSMN